MWVHRLIWKGCAAAKPQGRCLGGEGAWGDPAHGDVTPARSHPPQAASLVIFWLP